MNTNEVSEVFEILLEEIGERLARLDLEALPPERRERVEELLEELEELLRKG